MTAPAPIHGSIVLVPTYRGLRRYQVEQVALDGRLLVLTALDTPARSPALRPSWLRRLFARWN